MKSAKSSKSDGFPRFSSLHFRKIFPLQVSSVSSSIPTTHWLFFRVDGLVKVSSRLFSCPIPSLDREGTLRMNHTNWIRKVDNTEYNSLVTTTWLKKLQVANNRIKWITPTFSSTPHWGLLVAKAKGKKGNNKFVRSDANCRMLNQQYACRPALRVSEKAKSCVHQKINGCVYHEKINFLMLQKITCSQKQPGQCDIIHLTKSSMKYKWHACIILLQN